MDYSSSSQLSNTSLLFFRGSDFNRDSLDTIQFYFLVSCTNNISIESLCISVAVLSPAFVYATMPIYSYGKTTSSYFDTIYIYLKASNIIEVCGIFQYILMPYLNRTFEYIHKASVVFYVCG